MMKKIEISRKGITIFMIIFAITALLTSCLSPPSLGKAGISFDTTLMKIPKNIKWASYKDAFEMIHPFKMTVVFEDASDPITKNPISAKEWLKFKSPFPWMKNQSRKLMFNAAYFVGSPSVIKSGNTSANTDSNYVILDIGSYSWLELAKVKARTIYPGGRKASGMNPKAGQLIFTTVIKPQINRYVNEIYQMTDGKGNYFVMHATVTGKPRLDVKLPNGWILNLVKIDKPLIVTPTVNGYVNIIGDNLGQGYHQYIYADDRFNSDFFLK